MLREDSEEYHLATPVDNGLRILGALALMPPGSGIAIQDHEHGVYGYAPRFTLQGADPYPAGLQLGPSGFVTPAA